MSTLLTAYILIWPIISAGVLGVLIVALIRDMIIARKEGDAMI